MQRDSKSYPFLGIAHHYGVPYEIVLAYADQFSGRRQQQNYSILPPEARQEIRDRWHEIHAPETTKCRACGRWVKHPCHDAEGYYTEGPWDYSCEGVFEPNRYA